MAINTQDFENVLEEYIRGVSIERILKARGISLLSLYSFLDANPIQKQRFEKVQCYRVEIDVDNLTTIADEETDSARARNRIDVRKWRASKLIPAKYGERIDVNMNNTIDIRQAMADARSRVLNANALLPPSDLRPMLDAETIELISTKEDRAMGQEPIAQAISNTEEKDASKNDDDDIFS